MLTLDEVVVRLQLLEAALADRVRQIAERDARIVVLERRVAELEEQLRQANNPSRPPSSDSPAQRLERRARKSERHAPSGKKQGAQPGHKAHKRALMPPEQVNAVVVCALGHCQTCGLELDGSHDIGMHREQVVELPPITPVVTEYQIHRRQCAGCGDINIGKRPANAPPGGFGPRLTSLAAMLTGVYHLSRRSAVTVLQDVFGIRMSTGALSTCEQRVSSALDASYEEAREHVQNAPTRHIDATTWYTKANRSAVWVVATTLATVIAMTATASRQALLGIVGRITGRVVSDRSTVFNCWQGAQRQTCWAHLLRYFEGMAQRDGPAGQVGETLCSLTLTMFSVWHDFKRGVINRTQLQALIREPRGDPDPKIFVERFRALLNAGIACGDKSTQGTCRDLLENHWDSLWVFIDVDDVEPTNNHAEQELRSTVKWRRTSFGSQSERGDRFAERMMTASRTIRKQRRSIDDFISETLRAHWAGEPKPALLPKAA